VSFANFQNSEPRFTPRFVAIILAIFGVILTVILYFLLREVFAGNWKINQQIELFNIPVLKILDWSIPIGQINLRFYSLCIFLGVLCGYSLTLYLAKFHYIAGTIIDRLLIGLIVFGIIGARMFFVLFNWSSFAGNPANIVLGISQGGMAIFGAFLTSFIYIWLYCEKFRFNLWEFLDFIAPGVLIGQVLGRFGNFFNYEAYGPATSIFWKMFIPDTANFADLNQKYFHPTFLYEIIPNFILLISLLFLYQNLTSRHSGLVFGLWAFFYGLIRFFTEFFRLDALKLPMPFNLSIPYYNIPIQNLLISQVMAVALSIFGIIVIFRRQNVLYLKKTMSEYFL
jgi:phosphatidylglycerol---prolipoprotein diacylglyceryl transferase